MKFTSCPDAIAKTIERVYQHQVELGNWAAAPEMDPTPKSLPAHAPVCSIKGKDDVAGKMHFCPECGTKLEHEGGCVMCRQCGYSKCG
jgi:ribonucleoside-diphosphate reductase alpha chain